MAGEALVIGFIVIGSALVVTVVAAVLLFRRRSSSGVGNPNAVPPPVDSGPGEPEQARDVNADKQSGIPWVYSRYGYDDQSAGRPPRPS